MELTETTCIYNMYGCKIGSTIYLKVNTKSDYVTWTFNGKQVESITDLRKGFEKKDANCNDTGKYKCIVDNEERFVFDVIVYDNYDTYECRVGSTINLRVHTDSKFARWTLNGEDVKSEDYPYIGFKKDSAEFGDSGRYECTVAGTVIDAFDVIIYDRKCCEIGGVINIDVLTEPYSTAWFLNGDNVKSEVPEKGFVKHDVFFKDFGRYLCRVGGIVRYAYDVIQMKYVKCKLGSTISLKVDTRTSSPTWTLNGENISFECNEGNALEKANADFGDSGTYEWTHNGSLRCVFDVIVYDVYECDIGSTIFLEVNSSSNCPTWYYKGQIVDSICDKNKGFKKQNAKLSDSGRYEGKVDGIVKYTFDVIIHDNVEVELGSTLHLMEKTVVSALWTFNGKPVSTECKLEKGFEKKNANYTDSGRYEYIEKDVVKNTFDVIIYGCYQKHECRVGSTINLEINADLCCPTWTFGKEKVLSEWCPHKGFEKKNADFRDTGKYRCKIDDNVTHVFEVIVYEYLFEDELLGIRITVPVESVEKKPGKTTRSISRPFFENEDEMLKHVFKTGTVEQVENKSDRISRVVSQIVKGKTKRNVKDDVFPKYDMSKNPRGIAVIITIGEFQHLHPLEGLDKDAERCEKVFKDLSFDVKKCEATTQSGIDDFLTEIANKNHDQYDCFMLLFGSHGGNGYICCSDFDNEKATGFFECHKLINKFLSVPSLLDKPKIFFFDSCRKTIENLVKGIEESPIRALSNAKDISKRYRHLLIGYGSIVGTSSDGTADGGYYTQQLLKCLEKYAKTVSFLDVVTLANHFVDDQLKDDTDTQVTEVRSTLSYRIIMVDLKRKD